MLTTLSPASFHTMYLTPKILGLFITRFFLHYIRFFEILHLNLILIAELVFLLVPVASASLTAPAWVLHVTNARRPEPAWVLHVTNARRMC